MLSESKIKEKIAKHVFEAVGSGSLCWIPKPSGEFDPTPAKKFSDECVDQIYQLFLPALEALVQAEDMIVGEFCSHSGSHDSSESCYADFIYKALNKLNGD